MRWKRCKLYRRFKKQNELLQWVYEWDEVGSIEVCINATPYKVENGDTAYRKFEHTALSKYKAWDLDAAYKIVCDYEYEVMSINNATRYAQLVLKRTTVDGKMYEAKLDGNILMDGSQMLDGAKRVKE